MSRELESKLHQAGDQSCSTADTDLVEDGREVELHCAKADPKSFGNTRVRHAEGHQAQHLALTSGQLPAGGRRDRWCAQDEQGPTCRALAWDRCYVPFLLGRARGSWVESLPLSGRWFARDDLATEGVRANDVTARPDDQSRDPERLQRGLERRQQQSRMDNSREVVMTELATVDVLIIDDFALEPMSREESRDIYQLVVERNARLSTVVTSNRDTAEWIAAFDDALLAQSAVDRFKNNAFDLVVDGESYRSRLKPIIEKLPPPPSAPVKKVAIHPRTKAAARRR